MATPAIQTAFVSGELAPSLFGHVDLARYHVGASTMRNFWVNFRGGAYSRAGTAFVGFSKQTGRNYPPRLIDFQFNINQGLALEFGNFYMRVIYDGAFVTENFAAITGATKASPCVLNTSALGVASATANNAGVSISYAPSDTITLAGGITANPGVLEVTQTTVLAATPNLAGSGYVPGDTIVAAGGTQLSAPNFSVTTTQVVSAVVASGGTGGTNGTQTVTGTTGTGTKFQVSVTISGGAITAVLGLVNGGIYTVNPTTLTNEPVTGAGLTGAHLSIQMGIQATTLTAGGVFTANPASLVLTQASSSGSGTGAGWHYCLMGIHAVTVSNPGIYTSFPSNPVSQASTSGIGLGATFTLTSMAVSAYNNGDWVFISGVGGMTQLNGNTYVVGNATTSSISLYDVYGDPIDSTSFGTYTSGGSVARIYTLTTPYAEEDLGYLKLTQSADVMSIACVNQMTGTEYAPQDLSRISDTDWVFSPVVPEPTVTPPTNVAGSASSSGSVYYQYQVTAINPNDGSESVASTAASIPSAVDIASTAGSITISWTVVANVNQYYVYKATPTYDAPVPTGVLFGFAGYAYGNQFVDSNIVADFSQVPPLHKNPFARGQIIGSTIISGGSGYTAINYTINTSTGSGAILELVLQNGSLVAVIILDAGENYGAADTITLFGTGGAGAQATLNIGAQTGTYPSVINYYQERRVYGNSLNNPDTYWMSQPGAFTNFDSRIPTIDSDAISGSPWSVQVNGLQWFVSMPGGLVALTGLGAWQLTGAGGGAFSPQPITPSNQSAQPQAYNGCSPTVPPIKIDYEIIYLQAKGSTYRDLSYQFYQNIYTGTDLSQNSSQLFTGFTIGQHCWCEEPNRLLWSVRSDGTLLSLTYNKPQEVAGWARHDTQGLFQSVCSVTEPPVDALYCAVQRFPGNKTAYMIERMNNRIWSSAEESWCVDCGLELQQGTRSATLTASTAVGLGSLTGVTGLIGGANYSTATYAYVVDDNGNGPGTGATPTLTIVAGVITAVAFAVGHQGSGYTYPALVIIDPANTGSGASAHCVLNNAATFTASASVFTNADVGSIIRMGGGIVTVTAFVGGTQLTGNITSPIVTLLPNSGGIPQTAVAGDWTITAPVTVIGGLNHLAGATVTGVADGQVIPAQAVSASGTITLATPATAVIVGLAFQAQLQSLPLDAGQPTIQGQRKDIPAVTARIEASRGIKIGSNQPDGSTLSPAQLAPTWNNMAVAPDKARAPYNSLMTPLYTGDVRIPVEGGFDTHGQVAIQQDNPLPCNILALIPEVLQGDIPEQQASPRERRAA